MLTTLAKYRRDTYRLWARLDRRARRAERDQAHGGAPAPGAETGVHGALAAPVGVTL